MAKIMHPKRYVYAALGVDSTGFGVEFTNNISM